MSHPSTAIEKAFDKAIDGAKAKDVTAIQNLGGLLASIATATDDGPLMIAGFSFGSCAGVLGMLKGLEVVNPPGLKELLDESFRELRSCLELLKPQMTRDNPDPQEILNILGRVAQRTFLLNQKMVELQRFPSLGGISSVQG